MDSGKDVEVVARKERPPKCRSGWRLVQSVAGTWWRGKVSLVCGLYGKPSHKMVVATVSTLVGQTKAVG